MAPAAPKPAGIVEFGARLDYSDAAAFNRAVRQVQQHNIQQDRNTYMKKLIVLSLALLIAGAVAVRAADAKENWDKSCKVCHGADGKGKTKMGEKYGIKDYTDAKVQDGMKDDAMVKAIKEGVKEDDKTKMKAFGDVLSEDEIKALVKYIRDFKK
jgi:mono/diheme cytochrome c family protein